MQAVERVTGVAETTNGLKFELGNLHKTDQWKGGVLFNDPGRCYG